MLILRVLWCMHTFKPRVFMRRVITQRILLKHSFSAGIFDLWLATRHFSLKPFSKLCFIHFQRYVVEKKSEQLRAQPSPLHTIHYS